MHWTDLTRPEGAFALVARLFAALLVMRMVVSLVTVAFSRIHFSMGGGLPILAGLGLLIIAAYLIREHRLRERVRPRNTRGAERTTLLPHLEEDDQ